MKDYEHQADLLLAFQFGEDYVKYGKAQDILEEFNITFGTGPSEFHEQFELGVAASKARGG